MVRYGQTGQTGALCKSPQTKEELHNNVYKP